jgi:hypothetical protein
MKTYIFALILSIVYLNLKISYIYKNKKFMKKFLMVWVNEIIYFLQRFNHECMAFLGAGILINLMPHVFNEFQLGDIFQLKFMLRVMFLVFLILVVSSSRY